MNATKILWSQVFAVCAVALAFVWAATQWTAAVLGYQAQLGRPWFRVDGYPVYHPPAFFWWWFAYDAYLATAASHLKAAPTNPKMQLRAASAAVLPGIETMSTHPGAIWHRVDFQCHAPRDRGWEGSAPLPGGTPPLEQARRDWAAKFVAAAIDRSLSMVAVTDNHDRGLRHRRQPQAPLPASRLDDTRRLSQPFNGGGHPV